MSKLKLIGIATKVVFSGGKYIVTLFCEIVNGALARLSYDACESIGNAIASVADPIRSIGGFCGKLWAAFWEAVADLVKSTGTSIADRNLEEIEAEKVWAYTLAAYRAFVAAKKGDSESPKQEPEQAA